LYNFFKALNIRMPPLHPSYRPDIDGLRAIAVLFVVMHHAFPQILPSGFIGVDLFFVISGFLISTIIFQHLENGTFSFSDFYVRRIKRIFPALILVLLTCLVYGWFSLLPADYKQLGKHSLAGAAFVSNFAFWNESGYFDGDSKLKPLLHLWSLGIEEQYYIFWPLIAWLAWKKKVNLLKLCIVLLVVSFIANLVIVRSNTVSAFYSPASRFWELLIGSVLACVKLNQAITKEKQHSNLLAWLGLSLLIIGLVFIHPERRFPGFWALFPTLSAYLIMSAGPNAWLNRVVLSNRVLVWVGLISFPLYLWHWPLLVFAKQSATQQPSVQSLLLIIAISMVLAWLTYRLIERPIRFGKLGGGRKALFLSLLMITIGYLGFNIYKREGLGFRIPPALQKIATFSNDYYNNSNYECLIQNSDKDIQNPRPCFENIGNKSKSILLWGDSYAWAIYAGINKVALPHANVYLMAKTGCPPLLEVERTAVNHCKPQNARVIEAIKTEKYDQVVLIARWDHWTYQSDKYMHSISATVDYLKNIGVRQIYIMGPPPEWHPGLQDVLVSHALRDKLTHRLAHRLSEGVTVSSALDLQLSQLAQEKGISYISLLNILCDKSGCLTRVGDEPEDLIGYDDGHLSRKGGEYVAKQLPLDFFKLHQPE
jgi:peptidoglycan/LPS O-acetylase OafA/YrhL